MFSIISCFPFVVAHVASENPAQTPNMEVFPRNSRGGGGGGGGWCQRA